MTAAVILGKPDQLEEQVRRFEQAELKHTVFLNSVPKCGTHLIRNIVRMFVPVEQQYHRDFIQLPNLSRHLQAFAAERRYVSWGHLLFCDESALALKHARHAVLVRDPYDWVLARARFYLSDEFQGPLNHIKHGAATIEQVLNMMIFGVHQKAPSLLDIYTHNAVAWQGTGVALVRYEDIVRHLTDLNSRAAEAFFRQLLSDCGIGDLPVDWRERVEIGADRRLSRTARENLTQRGAAQVPGVLPDAQKALVDFAAPGLRARLGYV